MVAVLALAANLGVAAAAGAAGRAEALLALGIEQYESGDFEAAVFTLDSAVRRSSTGSDRVPALARAHLYLGATYARLEQKALAQAKFREALRLQPAIRPSPGAFPPKVAELFEEELLKLTATRRRRGRKVAAVVAGAAAVTAVGVSAATNAPPPNRPPTVTIGVEPPGQAIVGVTMMTFTVTGSDPDGDALSYAWDLGDGTAATGDRVRHRFDREGTLTVRVSASDPERASGSGTATVISRSLTGAWLSNAQEDHACTQTGDVVDCPNLSPTPRAWRVFRFQLVDPRGVRGGEVTHVNSPPTTCSGGEVTSDLNRFVCVIADAEAPVSWTRR